MPAITREKENGERETFNLSAVIGVHKRHLNKTISRFLPQVNFARAKISFEINSIGKDLGYAETSSKSIKRSGTSRNS